MSTMAISPVPFVNAASFDIQEPQAQSRQQDDAQTARAQAPSNASSSSAAGVAAQAFTGFPPDIQPIASLSPSSDIPQPLPAQPASDSSASPEQWSANLVDVYA